MECTTTRIDEFSGESVQKEKRKFDTLELAISHCKKMNILPDRIAKIVSYKCNTCHKFHVGRNGNEIKDKERAKNTQKKNDFRGFKFLGSIDLSKVSIK